jgi:hypothetical protein
MSTESCLVDVHHPRFTSNLRVVYNTNRRKTGQYEKDDIFDEKQRDDGKTAHDSCIALPDSAANRTRRITEAIIDEEPK